MNINTRDLGFVNFNGEEMQWVKFNNVIVYEAWRKLIASGVPPLALTKCKGVDLVDYKIYGNSVQEGTPTPDTPIEVESVGEKTINFFKIPEKSSSTVEVLKNGLKSLANQRCPIMATIPDLEVGKTYTCKVNLKAPEGSGGTSGQIIYTDGTNNLYLRSAVLNESVRTFTLKEGVNYNQLWFYGKNVEYLDIMIVEGSYTLNNFPEYEPYGYKIPITVSGENLFDATKITKGWLNAGNGTISPTNSITTDYIPLNYNQTLYVYNESNARFQAWGVIYDENFNPILPYISKTSGKTDNFSIINPYENGKYIRFTTAENSYLKPETLETTRISYVEPVTTDIYLNEPLRKIGNYADYIDFENQKVIRNVAEIDIQTLGIGSFAFDAAASKEDRLTASVYSANLNKPKIDSLILSNYFAPVNVYSNEEGVRNVGTPAFIGFNVLKTRLTNWDENLTDNEKRSIVNDYLATLTDLKVYYPISTDNTETIELPNIPTFKGTNIIEVDTKVLPSNMEVEYYGKE